MVGTAKANARLAQAAILAQVMDAVESKRHAAGITMAGIAKRAGLSRRTLIYLQKLQTDATLATLLSVVDAVGLELEIRLRHKKPATPRPDAVLNDYDPR